VVRHAVPLHRPGDAMLNQEFGVLPQLHYRPRWIDVPMALEDVAVPERFRTRERGRT
jgi:hypothetical protein